MADEKLHLRLTMDVTYDLDGTSENELREQLDRVAKLAFGEGLLTLETPATVDEWEHKVEKIS